MRTCLISSKTQFAFAECVCKPILIANIISTKSMKKQTNIQIKQYSYPALKRERPISFPPLLANNFRLIFSRHNIFILKDTPGWSKAALRQIQNTRNWRGNRIAERLHPLISSSNWGRCEENKNRLSQPTYGEDLQKIFKDWQNKKELCQNVIKIERF